MPVLAQTFAPGGAEMTLILVFLAFLGVFFAVGFIPWILYLLTLQKALSRCSVESRTLQPGLVWLVLVPLFNLVWIFIVVVSVSTSLGNEFRRRGIPEAPNPGQDIGLAMAICNIVAMTPLVGIPVSVAGFVCWIVHWVRIAEYSSRIAVPAVPAYAV